MASNPLQRFIRSRFIQPAVNAEVEKALSQSLPPAFGVSVQAQTSLRDTIGQPHDADYSLLYSVYKLNTDVASCVHKWAGGVVGPGWRITTMDPDVTPSDALNAEIDEITRWMKNPNPHKLLYSMLYEGMEHWGIVGNFYWHVTEDKRGRPLELWPMHPALTRVVANDRGERLGYIMQPRSGQPVPFDAHEVLDFPLPNPMSDLYGESPLELVLEEAGIDLQALRSNKAIFQNGMNPSAVMLMDDQAKQTDATAMTDMLKQAHAGSSNQHKIVALSRVKDFKVTTLTHRDMEYLGLRDLSTSKVTRAYRIPKVLLGDHNAGDYATTKFLILDTYRNVYAPMQDIIAEIITERLIHRFNPELRFEFIRPNASDPDEVRRDQMQAKRDSILTADEVRDESFDKPPLETDEASDQAPTNEPSKDAQRPDTDAADSAEDAPQATKALTKALDDTATDTIADERSRAIDSLSAPLIQPIAGYFTQQERDYLEALTDQLNALNLDEYLNQNQASYDTVLTMLLASLLLPTLQAATTSAQLQVGFSLGFQQTNPLIQEYLQTQTAQHVTGINQTTRERLRATLQAGIDNRETLDQLKVRISDQFEEFRGYRAELIARNEVINAYTHGNHETLRQLFEQGVISHRRWLTAQDDRVRPSHAELHGYTIRFDANFPDDMEPGEAINCRCTEIGLALNEVGI